ncbi:flagellar basal body rod protein FlgG [Alteribacter natronophilus]|uniref:flagellar basal body rod protein FlgG n=1 Tax=Alteribacter natronophilus TaxID=2583810 RepID=UPI00110DA67A|nr:flagellar basal body rod protein FlgG [Alteribacter natronophilus]TMW73220.1 flagellar basal body rod protein FlgG [Alteribacter natronophilus]
MIRSMYASIGGMKNFQTKLDVIGNNIANVNTHGFKKGRTTFQDLVSQQVGGASAAAENRGGTNPLQVGLGSGMSSIDTIQNQGSLQSTGRQLDMAISGDGYFMVSDGGEPQYTRAGNFYLDNDGNLVNGSGMIVQGYGSDGDEINTDEEPINLGFGELGEFEGFDISSTGIITAILEGGDTQTVGQIALATFDNPGGLEKTGDNLYQVSSNSGAPAVDVSGTGGRGDLVGAALEMSNVDLAEEFAEMIVGQRGFQANTRMITTSDEILQELVNLKR